MKKFQESVFCSLFLAISLLLISGCNQKSKSADNGTDGDNADAILILSDGSKIMLDSGTTKAIKTEAGGCEVSLSNGKLLYSCKGDSGSGIVHKLAVLKGNRFGLVLSDSTEVMINTGTMISYPVSFANRPRELEMNGEIFINIRKDSLKPFLISPDIMFSYAAASGSFNINAYTGSRGLIVTTLSDSIAQIHVALLGKDNKNLPQLYWSGILFMDADREEQRLPNGSVRSGTRSKDQTLAWTNNRFGFDKMDITEAMEEIARWYDIEVEYIGEPPYFDYTEMPGRDIPLPDLLKLFETYGARFKIEKNGKKVVVIGQQ